MCDIPLVLIVDDNLNNFDVIEAFLLPEGYQIHYAANGYSALDFLQSTQPDVILLDVMMPDIDGIEVCRRIKANPDWRPIPVIMVTALTEKSDLARCLEAGATDFISKPVSNIELRARVRAMLRMKQQYDEVQKLLKLREAMVNIVVHDLRNPLTAILLSTAILKSVELPPERQRQKLDQIEYCGQELQHQIDSLLLLAKMESGKLELDLTKVDLHALCAETLAGFEAIANHKNLQLVADLPEPGQTVLVDGLMLRRVIDNLLSNAIKFSPSSSQITLSAQYQDGGGATIQVADLGDGIRDSLKTKIFEQFNTGDSFRNVPQLGIGLAFCQMAVNAHNGYITVEDNQPQGSIFTVHLSAVMSEITESIS